VNAALLLLALAQFEAPPITVVKPGAGYLIADGISEVPLEVVLNGGGEINSAKIKAEAGTVGRTTVITGNRVRFTYKCPKANNTTVEEVLDIQLRLANGNTTSTIYTLVIEPPAPAKVAVEAKPNLFDAASPPLVGLSASATGQKLTALQIVADKGEVVNAVTTGDEAQLDVKAELTPPELPVDAPSYLTLVAVASSERGYGLAVAGVSARAPVRLSVEIPPGSTLQVEGAENKPAPVVAPADGRTVLENVVVRYGTRVKTYVIEDGEKSPLSVVLPTGQVSPGVVAALPGQAVADGGTGPTLVVAIPPSALGGKVFWPDVTVEGAKLVKALPAGDMAKVLVLQRPVERSTVTVLLDEAPAGAVEFTSSRGVAIDFEPAVAEQGERAAAIAVVKDARGEPTDLPPPRARFSGGDLLPKRIGIGRYRVSLPPKTEGALGDQVELIAELPAAPLIAGDSLLLVSATTKVQLQGPGPAVKAEEPPPVVVETPKEEPSDASLAIGIAAAGLVGASFSQALMLGAGLQVELRLPFWEERLGVRTGVEFVHHSQSAEAIVGSGKADVKTRIAGFLIPLEVIFAYVTLEIFEATVRAGGDVRFERGAISVAGDNAGGESRVGGSARFGLDAILKLGDAGRVTLGVTLGGLGASADGFSGAMTELSGSLIGMRADLSYGFWFR
jgi:hypothetical protein